MRQSRPGVTLGASATTPQFLTAEKTGRGPAIWFIAADKHAEPQSTAHLARLIQHHSKEAQDKKLRQIEWDTPITDIEAAFLVNWMWSKHPSLGGALENAVSEAIDDTTMA